MVLFSWMVISHDGEVILCASTTAGLLVSSLNIQVLDYSHLLQCYRSSNLYSPSVTLPISTMPTTSFPPILRTAPSISPNLLSISLSESPCALNLNASLMRPASRNLRPGNPSRPKESCSASYSSCKDARVRRTSRAGLSGIVGGAVVPESCDGGGGFRVCCDGIAVAGDGYWWCC
jgi:hypothetical protein